MNHATNPSVPPNNGIDPGPVVQYPVGALTDAKMKQAEQYHKGLKNQFDTANNVDNQLEVEINTVIKP